MDIPEYIYPSAYKSIGSAAFSRAYDLIKATAVIRYEMEHGLENIPVSARSQVVNSMKMTLAVIEGTLENEMKEVINYWSTYTLRRNENVRKAD